MKSRLLRLYLVRDSGGEDQPMVYVHKGSSDEALCNGEEASLTVDLPGKPIAVDGSHICLHMVISGGDKLKPGWFLAFPDGGAVLRLPEPSPVDNKLEVMSPGFATVSEICHIWEPIKTAILTISDKGSRGEREDTAGPALVERAARIGARVVETDIVPDEVDVIRDRILSWSRDGVSLIMCTGGTGLSKRDVTPEAIEGIAEKLIPGIGEMMRMRTSQSTVRSFLSRGLGAVVGQSMVLAFPGSRRGAVECFEALEPVIRHGVEIISGKAGECGQHH